MRILLLVPVAIAIGASCGDFNKAVTTGSSGAASGGNTGDVDPNKKIDELTMTELGGVCALYGELIGGWGARSCADGTTVSPTSGSPDACVMNAQANDASCAATVAVWVGCARVLAHADPCDGNAVATAQNSQACQAFYAGGGVCVNIN